MRKNNKKEKIISPFQHNMGKLRRNKLAMFGLIVVLLFVFCSAAAPWLTPFEPDGVDIKAKLIEPCKEHLFGTDKLGRDVFTRILFGGRVSILIGVVSAVGAGVLGVVLGAICGYNGGIFDKIMLRISEVFMSFPQTIIILLFVALLGQGTANLFIVFICTGWTSPFRLVRGKYIAMREENYVDTCRAFGVSQFSIMFSHILPNTLGPIVVNITAHVAMFILSESALSFLGLGVPSSVVTWGNIINAAKDVTTVKNYPWLWLPAGMSISLFVLAINFLGDGLRDIFDPTSR